jgi:hypothetical protein
MAIVVKDRVKVSSTTTGTGTFTLGSADTGYQNFAAIGDGNQTFYTITAGADWEVGIGTYTSSGTTLSRDTVLSSSNSNNLVNWGVGDKAVFVVYPAEGSVYSDGCAIKSPSGAIFVNQTTMDKDTEIASGENGFTVGPITVASGVTFTIASGQRYIVL